MCTLTCKICEEEKPERQVKDIRICEDCLNETGQTHALRRAIQKALQEIQWGKESQATQRLIDVLEGTK